MSTAVSPVSAGGAGVPPVPSSAPPRERPGRRRAPLTVRDAILEHRWSCSHRGEPANWVSLDCCSITDPSLPSRLAALRAELDEIERLHREALSLSSASSAPPRDPASRPSRPSRSNKEPAPC